MNGDELAATIKSLDPHQPVVMITAYPESLAASGNPLVGVDLVLGKPFGLHEVREATTRLLTKQ